MAGQNLFVLPKNKKMSGYFFFLFRALNSKQLNNNKYLFFTLVGSSAVRRQVYGTLKEANWFVIDPRSLSEGKEQLHLFKQHY